MAYNIDITSANAEFIITFGRINLTAKMQQFSVDSAWQTEDAETAVAQKGVDGFMSAGWVPRLNIMTINFMPNSESIKIFDRVVDYQDVNRCVVTLQGVLTLPSLGKSFILSNGVVTRHKSMPDGGRVLAPHHVQIQWESQRAAVI